MSRFNMIKSVKKEYGTEWLINRSLYEGKLKLMGTIQPSEKVFEKNTPYPVRLDLFHIDTEALSQILIGLDSKDKENLLGEAEKSCNGIIKAFSSIDLNYGNPIDWQLNPLTSKRCDENRKWYRIPDFDKERGDIKVVWEASRFSHFITLARAYLLTKNEKYYQAFSNQLNHWLLSNPYGYGANYKCGQECSLRMANVLLAYTIFNSCGIVNDADSSNVKDLIDRCYRKVLSNFFYAYKCIKNNHTISELLGMIIGAWCCNDNKQLNKAYEMLDEVIIDQFTDDGGYKQFSFNYQRLALQDLECVLSIENRTGKLLSAKSKQKIRNAAYLMYQCQATNGDMPNYGNNDGALIFPTSSCGYRDFRPVINTVYALLTGKQLYEDDKHQEELVWFSNGKKLSEFGVNEIDRVSSTFKDAGLFTIRDNRSWVMMIANDYHSRPGHMDQNHIDIWVDDVNVLCDSGTFSYASDLGRQFVNNTSHNTICVEDIYQMNTRGPFMLYDWTKRFLGTCDNNTLTNEIASKNGYLHYRQIKRTASGYVVNDKSDRSFKTLFHTPCEVVYKNDEVILLYSGKEMCKIKCNKLLSVIPADRSLYYLKKDPISCIVIAGGAGETVITEIEVKKENY